MTHKYKWPLVCTMLLTLFSGRQLKAQYTQAFLTIGTASGDGVGLNVDSAGDVNGDGYDDVVIGSLGGAGNPGKVEVVSGFDGSIIHSLSGPLGSVLGGIVSGAGDVDNDGFDDFMASYRGLIPSVGQTGQVRLFSGATGLLLATFWGNTADTSSAFNLFGASMDSAGDVDADGTPDLVIGAPHEVNGANTGRVVVISGATLLPIYNFYGTPNVDAFGISVAGAGDINSDGYDDIIVGAPVHNNQGLIKIYSGFDGSLLLMKTGAGGSRLGSSVDGAGDIDRDGVADFVVGAPRHGSLSEGAAYAFSGANGSLIHSLVGIGLIERLGQSVAMCGDSNGDGHCDFIVVSRGETTMTAPIIRIHSGADGSVLFTKTGTMFTGTSQVAAGAGDFNNDGFSDLILGNASAVTGGMAEVILAPTRPILHFSSRIGTPSIQLDWQPTGVTPFSPTGVLVGSGASPNASGVYGVSLAPDDSVHLGLPFLIAVDSTVNLIETGAINFDSSGTLTTALISRQHPFVAGIEIFVQWFEIAPNLASSNAVRLLMIP